MATPHDETDYSSSEESLSDSALSLGDSDALTDVSSIEGFDADDDSTADARYTCLTETNGHSEVRIGHRKKIARWVKGSELHYVICKEGFPSTFANSVETAMREAVSMWQGRGVKLTQVQRHDKATFAVMYEHEDNDDACARSFFPNDKAPHTLMVYAKSREELDFLANILAHEIGHILGLRHERAHVRERDDRSELIGIENLRSVMNYHSHASKFRVKNSDLEGLDRFYALKQLEYKNLAIVDIDPEVRPLGEEPR
ncbi:hypothetical protein J3E68DRAFT_373922 [Trichoderma sp. SZMC 28012]